MNKKLLLIITLGFLAITQTVDALIWRAGYPGWRRYGRYGFGYRGGLRRGYYGHRHYDWHR